jgi:ParB family chromosome partitioning protein
LNRKSTIDSLFVQKGEGKPLPLERVKTGAISAMGTSLKQLTESAKAASRLQEQFAAGAVVIEIEPDKIDASLIKDRIAVEVDSDFEALVESIRSSGQQVPILVRPLEGGRYQIAYGHRRARAAAKIGVKVKALVRELTDAELVVAQGKENLDRKDLSFIERARFACRLEKQGFDRNVIMAALSTDKADLSRYISIANSIPEKIIEAIGPAPKVGRPRWASLAEKLDSDAAYAVIRSTEFKVMDSDDRFAAVLNAISRRPPKETTWACDRQAKIDRKADKTVLTINVGFGAYLVDRLDDLYREFQERKTK